MKYLMPNVISMIKKKWKRKSHEEIQTTSKCQFLKIISAIKQNLNSVFLFFQMQIIRNTQEETYNTLKIQRCRVSKWNRTGKKMEKKTREKEKQWK